MSSELFLPTGSKERIQALDFLRGFAILGILIMNIQSFSMPGAAYLNPMAYGDMTGANKWVWILSHIFADQKFMTIFSILFGAGVILATQRAEERIGSSKGYHYRRTLWLLLIGLFHAHLIWSGDILVAYALCGFIVYLFRKKKPRTLLIIGLIVISIHTILYTLLGLSIENWPEESIQGVIQAWSPDPASIQTEIAELTGSLSDQIGHVSASSLFMETFVFLFIFLWRAGGLMLVGMALYKWGVLTAKKSNRFYKKGLIISWIVGFPIVIFGIYKNYQAEWVYSYSMYLGSQFNYWGSLFVSFGYICGIMLISKSGIFSWIRDRLAAVGQMALTNYIAQSVICIFIFYGIGFELLGQVERVGQMLVVLGVWAVQIIWSKPWLNRYRFGPLEWLWRSLTYLKKQALKK